MHILQPKHIQVKPEEVKEILTEYNISLSQLPKIKLTDPCVPEGCQSGEVLKIERKDGDNLTTYYRVVV